jgi:protocatechuate 3,4-dioxygenase beta subunit
LYIPLLLYLFLFYNSDGTPGIPLRLSIYVMDTNNCTPLVNALVDLWHCDAMGIYSHYVAASQGIAGAGNDNQTFLRGKPSLINISFL